MKPIALVIGDVMLDRRTEGEMYNISREAPAPVIRQTSLTESLGGAGNVAANIQALGHEVMLMGRIGDDPEGGRIAQLAQDSGIMACLVKTSAPTTVKHRITCGGQIITRIDVDEIGQDSPGPSLINGLALPPEIAAKIKVVVVADYDKGTMSLGLVHAISSFCSAYGIPFFADARPATADMYRGVTLLKPNLSEALEMLADVTHPGLAGGVDDQQCSAVACQELKKRFGTQLVVVTSGRYGCSYTDPEDNFQVHFREPYGNHEKNTVRDICGAGDTVMAALAAGFMEGKTVTQSVDLAMKAASYVVQFYGVCPAVRDEVEDFAHAHGNWANKLMGMDQLLEFVARTRRIHPHANVVLANGCFDGFHAGHLELLRFAKSQGEVLIVAYNDDASLIELKGPPHPHVPESYRGSHLAMQSCVDAVVRFDGDAEKLVRQIDPDVLVKGADAARAPIPGADYLAQHGGRVVLCPLDDFAINIDRTNTTTKP